MKDAKRRRLLEFTAALLGGPLVGCGDGKDAAEDGAAPPPPSGAPSPTSIPAPSPPVPEPVPTPPPPLPAMVTPAWLLNKRSGEWVQIPGTEGAGGAAIDAYCGMALHETRNEIVIAAAGGHTDSADNRVVSLVLTADQPQWVLRASPSASVQLDVSHYADGLPSSRHLYHSAHVVESLNRVFLFGARFVYGTAVEFPTVDAFDLQNNRWDPKGTWSPIPSGGAYGAVRVRSTGDVYTSALHRWSASTQRWSQPINNRTAEFVRWPIAYDSRRNQLFSLQFGDGQGYDTDLGVQASRVPLGGNTQFSVTLRASAALTQFKNEAPIYAGMDYDVVTDRFLFYSGFGGAAGRIYSVTPNDTDTWDIAILPLAAGSALPPGTAGGGVNSRFRYVPALRGFVMLPGAASRAYFIRTV